MRRPPPYASCAPPPRRPSPLKSPASPSKIAPSWTTWLLALPTPLRGAPPPFALLTSSPRTRESAHDPALAPLVSLCARHRRRNCRYLPADFAPQHPPSREIAAAQRGTSSPRTNAAHGHQSRRPARESKVVLGFRSRRWLAHSGQCRAAARHRSGVAFKASLEHAARGPRGH